MNTPTIKAGGKRRIWPIVVGIIAFAALMALRYELSSPWTRAATAAVAFVILYCGIAASRKRPA